MEYLDIERAKATKYYDIAAEFTAAIEICRCTNGIYMKGDLTAIAELDLYIRMAVEIPWATIDLRDFYDVTHTVDTADAVDMLAEIKSHYFVTHLPAKWGKEDDVAAATTEAAVLSILE